MKKESKKIIIFTCSGIGDFVLSTSAISLVNQYDDKNIKITLVMCEEYLSLVDKKKLKIDKIVTLKHKYHICETNKFIRWMYKILWSIKNFYIFYKQDVLLMFANAKFFKLFAKNICRVKIIVDPSVIQYKNIHSMILTQSIVRHIFPIYNLAIPILPNTSYLLSKIKKLIETTKKYKIALCTMSSSILRNWDIKYFDEIIKKINNSYDATFFIVGNSKKEINNGNYLIDNNKNCDVRNLCGKTTLLETKELLSNMNLLISVDTSIVHLAAVSNIYTISFYGFSLPSTFMGINHKAISLYSNEQCSPCGNKYYNNKLSCTYPKCMYNITPEIVFEKIKKIL